MLRSCYLLAVATTAILLGGASTAAADDVPTCPIGLRLQTTRAKKVLSGRTLILDTKLTNQDSEALENLNLNLKLPNYLRFLKTTSVSPL